MLALYFWLGFIYHRSKGREPYCNWGKVYSDICNWDTANISAPQMQCQCLLIWLFRLPIYIFKQLLWQKRLHNNCVFLSVEMVTEVYSRPVCLIVVYMVCYPDRESKMNKNSEWQIKAISIWNTGPCVMQSSWLSLRLNLLLFLSKLFYDMLLSQECTEQTMISISFIY